MVGANTPADAQAQEADHKLERTAFEQKYNNLVHSLLDFSLTYNNGQTMDVKKIKAIQKAWKELSKTDSFRTDKK